MIAYLDTMILGVEYAQYAITLVCNVRVHHLVNVYLAQILFLLKDHFFHHNALVLTNILMTLKINFASLVHLLAIVARVIKINVPNV